MSGIEKTGTPQREYAEGRFRYFGSLSGVHPKSDRLLAFATPVHGAALIEQGDVVAGLARIRAGVADNRRNNARYLEPFHLSLLARAEAVGGDLPCALALVNEALADAANRHELQHEAELHRIKGELCLQSAQGAADTSTAAAAASFQRALDIARRQQAKSWELRAATSLARLWQRNGKQTEALKLLSEIYHWFTEGFDPGDLKCAKALLDELSSVR